MSTTRAELQEKWVKTYEETRARCPQDVEDVENAIDMLRSAFNTLAGTSERNASHKMTVQLLNVSAAALEAGYANATTGYYQPAAACARMLYEQLAHIIYFEKRPEKAAEALANTDFRVPVRNHLEEHSESEIASGLVEDYSTLSRAAHPYQLSRDYGLAIDLHRISAFDEHLAKVSLDYLMKPTIWLLNYARAEVEIAGTNEPWLHRFDELRSQWLSVAKS